MKLSIIIPIYNVEKYLHKCLSSIYTQDLKSDQFELVIINDGTLDESMKIVEEYRLKYQNILVIEQENQGVSVARNNGVSNSSGDYLIFIDADDYILDNSLCKISRKLQANPELEILILNSEKSDSGEENYVWRLDFFENKIYSGTELFEKNFLRGSVCGCVFKRSFLISHQILFPIGVKNAEDTIFFACCQVWASKIMFSEIPFYSIYAREGSASRAFNREQLTSYDRGLYFVKCILSKDKGFTQAQKSILEYLKYILLSSMTYRAVSISSMSFSELLRICNLKDYLPIDIKGIPSKKKLKVVLMNMSFRLFYLLCKLKNRK